MCIRDRYYHSKLIECNIHQNNLEIELKIPLVRKNTHFDVYQLKHIPFFFNNKICQIKLENKIIIADRKNEIVKSMTDSDLTACNLQENLCHIPNFRILNSFDTCITAIHREEPQSEILTKCNFHCEYANKKEIVAEQLQENLFAISNFHTLLAVDTATNQKHTIMFNKTFSGSYLLEVPCTTEILNLNEGGGTQTIVPLGVPVSYTHLTLPTIYSV